MLAINTVSRVGREEWYLYCRSNSWTSLIKRQTIPKESVDNYYFLSPQHNLLGRSGQTNFSDDFSLKL